MSLACRGLVYIVHHDSSELLRSNTDIAVRIRDVLSEGRSKRPARQVSHRGLL
jgi:hypothetical protein